MGRSKDLATGTFTDGLTVDTSDQVIINHSGDAGGLRIDSTNNTNTGSIRFGDVADNYIGAVEYNHSTNALSFYANNATRMTIDSSGRVTKPSQPSFFARGDTNAWTSVSTGYRGYPTYDTPIFNIGSHFDTSNGRFTVPVNGLYYFTFHPYVKMNSDSDGSGYATTEILVNGNTYNGLEVIYGYYNAGDKDQVRTVTGIMSLSAGDYVTTALQANAAPASFYGRGCYFMGYLIG